MAFRLLVLIKSVTWIGSGTAVEEGSDRIAVPVAAFVSMPVVVRLSVFPGY